MYSDEFLTKLSFIIAIIGIVLLFIFAQNVEPLEVEIKNIDDSYAGRSVKINGDITEIFFSKDKETMFLTVADEKDIKIVMFKNDLKTMDENLSIADNVIITGKVALYKGDLEIIARSIKRE